MLMAAIFLPFYHHLSLAPFHFLLSSSTLYNNFSLFISFFLLARSFCGQWRIPVYYLPTGEMALKLPNYERVKMGVETVLNFELVIRSFLCVIRENFCSIRSVKWEIWMHFSSVWKWKVTLDFSSIFPTLTTMHIPIVPASAGKYNCMFYYAGISLLVVVSLWAFLHLSTMRARN